MTTKKKSQGYTTDDIDKPEGLEHIRLRPSRALGDEPMDTAFREIADNAFDEVSGGFANEVNVYVHGDNDFEIVDNGRGVPFDWSEKYDTNGIILTLGTSGAGRNFHHGSDAVVANAGTNGEGGAGANAVSTRFDVTSTRDKKSYTQQFKQGKPGKFKGEDFDPLAEFVEDSSPRKLEKEGKKTTSPNGTSVRWSFDKELLEGFEFHLDSVLDLIRYHGHLTPGSTLKIHRDGKTVTTQGEKDNGTVPLLKDITGVEDEETFTISGEGEFNIRKGVTRAFSWEVTARINPLGQGKTYGFVNGIYNVDGGTHVNNAANAIAAALSSKVPSLRGIGKKKGDNFEDKDFISTMDMVVSVRGADIAMKGQEKAAVSSQPLGRQLKKAVDKEMKSWVSSRKNNKALVAWGKAALALSREKKSMEAAKKRSRSKQDEKRFGRQVTVPAKLTDCRYSEPGMGAELYICEGESAGGTIKSARDSDFQAVFPIKGKILNVIKAVDKKIGANAEVSGIIDSIGAGIRTECDPKKSNYDKIIIAADADADGKHIENLIITIFYKMMPDLLAEGYLYVAKSPLYAIRGKNKIEYAYSPEERDEKKKEVFGNKTVPEHAVERFKGLGQMNSDDFENTVMNPHTRVIHQVSMEDAQEAVEHAQAKEEEEINVKKQAEIIREVMEALMDDDSSPRKTLMEHHGISKENNYDK